MTNDISSSIVSSTHPKISTLKTSNYIVDDSDYIIGIGTLTSDIVISLPASPALSSQFTIKDVNGTCGQFSVTIDGYGFNIDGNATFVMSQSYSSFTFLYTGSQWSVIVSYSGNQNGNGYGTYATLPKQGQSGRTYYATDTGSLYYDDGLAWKAFGHDGALTALKSADFSWQNQSGATATDFGNGIFISVPPNNNLRFLYQNVPSTPYTLTAKFIYLGSFVPASGMIYGLGLGDGTKLISAHVNDNSNAMNVNVACWDNPNTFNSALFNYNFRDSADRLEWLRISDDGSTRKFLVSRDGINFVELYSGSNTLFLTTTQVGIIVGSDSVATAHVSCVSFEML